MNVNHNIYFVILYSLILTCILHAKITSLSNNTLNQNSIRGIVFLRVDLIYFEFNFRPKLLQHISRPKHINGTRQSTSLDVVVCDINSRETCLIRANLKFARPFHFQNVNGAVEWAASRKGNRRRIKGHRSLDTWIHIYIGDATCMSNTHKFCAPADRSSNIDLERI